MYQTAGLSCAQYERGAACAAAAARIPSGIAGPAAAKFNRLTDCSLADVNKGSALMADAVEEAYEIQHAN